jgi:hypothetical protein
MIDDTRIASALYKRLLGLYPRAFRERFGESMEQTFRDLYAERRRKAAGGLPSFMLWMFVETALGIAEEHLFVVKEVNPMRSMLTSLRSPAIISFLIILPLMLLDVVVNSGARLPTFSWRSALDFMVLFGFLWLEVGAVILILMPIVRLRRVGEDANTLNRAPAQRGTAHTILTHPTFAAMAGGLLALPFVTIFSLLVLNIQPAFGPLEPLLSNQDPDQPNILGSLIFLSAFLLAVVACLIVREPIVRAVRSGGGLFDHPMHLLLAIAILFFILVPVVGIVADQYPCWIGVPNCD